MTTTDDDDDAAADHVELTEIKLLFASLSEHTRTTNKPL
jgi:hypothetical protein